MNNRLLSLTTGRAMIVTDLHGDWDAYQRYRDLFLTLQARGQADYLIFTGDLIHSEGPAETDLSLPIVLDVLALRQQLGDRLIYLLGNHELPHLYGITLQKGDFVYTPRFEAAMGEHRPAIIDLFDSLPLYVRTSAGVVICHAGASQAMAHTETAARILNYSHQQILERVKAALPPEERITLRQAISKLNGQPYNELVKELLAVRSPTDPRYDDLLIGVSLSSLTTEFELLWEALFNKNEFEYGDAHYAELVEEMLTVLSADFAPQHALVSGHIICEGGYTLVAGRQLRLASGIHAKPYNSAHYLLLDVERPITSVEELRPVRHFVKRVTD